MRDVAACAARDVRRVRLLSLGLGPLQRPRDHLHLDGRGSGPEPAFKESVPYAPVVIEMEEGVRVLSEVLDCSPDELEIGMPVEVAFDLVTPEVTLPKFRRARAENA